MLWGSAGSSLMETDGEIMPVSLSVTLGDRCCGARYCCLVTETKTREQDYSLMSFYGRPFWALVFFRAQWQIVFFFFNTSCLLNWEKNVSDLKSTGL